MKTFSFITKPPTKEFYGYETRFMGDSALVLARERNR